MTDLHTGQKQKHAGIIRRIAPECMVLLKSDGSFPLAGPCPVALYGSGARRTVTGGTGSGSVNARHVISIEEGLVNAGFRITTEDWLNNYDRIITDEKKRFAGTVRSKAHKDHMPAALAGMGAVMREPEYILPSDGEGDTAIYVLRRLSGEGSDRTAEKGDLLLTGTEIRDIHRICSSYASFLLVLNTAEMVDISPVMDVPNILLLSWPGAAAGDAFADVLLGRAEPSGRLTDTWIRHEDFPRIGDFGIWNNTHYKEGIYVGYRWADTTDARVLFPFGYGLSRTTFDLGLSDTAVSAGPSGDSVTVSFSVTNTGSFTGKETAELYVSVPPGKLDQPCQVLAAFRKTKALAPGESETVSLAFRMRDLSSFDTSSASEILERGDYIVRVGTDSRSAEPVCIVRLEEDVTIRALSHRGGKASFSDWKPKTSVRDTWTLPENLPVQTMNAGNFRQMDFPAPAEPDPAVLKRIGKLSDHQIALLVTGNHARFQPVSDLIGNQSRLVPGAAGETTGSIPGIPRLIMADGPAGLRLARDYIIDDAGHPRAVSEGPSPVTEYLPDAIRPAAERAAADISGRLRAGRTFHQYTTALPVETALAQSWNPEIWEACGDLIGEEMDRFHIDLWLAPAVNLHRNPLCGRNFEYCSEDPLLSGLFAAAVTEGVQKHPGKGVVIKHFAANNQETNRYNSNSVISERALRDLFMKPFEICIRQAGPAGVMTSYNLINGVHACERADLLKNVIRGEWGYHGLIMSDWVVPFLRLTAREGIYDPPSAGSAAAAGNNLFMPGSLMDELDVEKSLRKKDGADAGRRRSILTSAAWVLQTIKKLKGI